LGNFGRAQKSFNPEGHEVHEGEEANGFYFVSFVFFVVNAVAPTRPLAPHPRAVERDSAAIEVRP